MPPAEYLIAIWSLYKEEELQVINSGPSFASRIITFRQGIHPMAIHPWHYILFRLTLAKPSKLNQKQDRNWMNAVFFFTAKHSGSVQHAVCPGRLYMGFWVFHWSYFWFSPDRLGKRWPAGEDVPCVCNTSFTYALDIRQRPSDAEHTVTYCTAEMTRINRENSRQARQMRANGNQRGRFCKI